MEWSGSVSEEETFELSPEGGEGSVTERAQGRALPAEERAGAKTMRQGKGLCVSRTERVQCALEDGGPRHPVQESLEAPVRCLDFDRRALCSRAGE